MSFSHISRVRELLSQASSTRRRRRERQRTAECGVQQLEQRTLLSVQSVVITSITSTTDTDGAHPSNPNHVRIKAGEQITVNFSYQTSATGTTTAELTLAGVPSPNSVSGNIAPGTGTSSLSLTIPAATLPGTYNAMLRVRNTTGGGSPNGQDNEVQSVVIFQVTVTSVSLESYVYDGTGHAATASVAPVVPGTFTFEYFQGLTSLGATPPSDAGSYSVTATFTPSDLEHFTVSSDSVDYEIFQATSEVTVEGGTFTYDGNPHPATGISVTGAGGLNTTPTSIQYFLDGEEIVGEPVNAGTYEVVVTYDGDLNHTGSFATATIVIEKAASVTTVTGGTFTYDGNPHPATGITVTGAGGLNTTPTSIQYFLDGEEIVGEPVNAGTYEVVVTYDGDENHFGSSATATIVIEKAVLSGIATTQSALNIAKNGTLAFQIGNLSGFAGADAVNLFNGATFKLTIGTTEYAVQSTATVLNGTVHVSWTMTQALKDALAAYTQTKSASNAPTVALTVSAELQNYTFADDALTKLFSTVK